MIATFQSYGPVNNKAVGNQPSAVVLCFRDWKLGGTRAQVEISLWEAIQLRADLEQLFAQGTVR